jgi:2-polyprenyl-3-methyl-5-hydroxy-6-metoxy-1,4-benzoquinol methylase
MKHYGWDVYGTEINENAVINATEKLDLKNIKLGRFEDITWNQNFFDIVHMSMVLEHLHDPLRSLHLVHSVLKPKGQLILSVPDISGIEAKLYKDKCYSLHVPQHLSHFSPETIKLILNKNGFRVKKIIHQSFDRDLVSSAEYLNNKLLSRVLHNSLIRKTIVQPVVVFLSFIGKTSRMSVFAEKSDV